MILVAPQKTECTIRPIRQNIVEEDPAAYGAGIMQALSAKFAVEFGPRFSQRNLASIVRFAEVFPDLKIVSSLQRQLSRARGIGP